MKSITCVDVERVRRKPDSFHGLPLGWTAGTRRSLRPSEGLVVTLAVAAAATTTTTTRRRPARRRNHQWGRHRRRRRRRRRRPWCRSGARVWPSARRAAPSASRTRTTRASAASARSRSELPSCRPSSFLSFSLFSFLFFVAFDYLSIRSSSSYFSILVWFYRTHSILTLALGWPWLELITWVAKHFFLGET